MFLLLRCTRHISYSNLVNTPFNIYAINANTLSFLKGTEVPDSDILLIVYSYLKQPVTRRVALLGYDIDTNAGSANSVATAAMRFVASLMPAKFVYYNRVGRKLEAKNISDSFYKVEYCIQIIVKFFPSDGLLNYVPNIFFPFMEP